MNSSSLQFNQEKSFFLIIKIVSTILTHWSSSGKISFIRSILQSFFTRNWLSPTIFIDLSTFFSLMNISSDQRERKDQHSHSSDVHNTLNKGFFSSVEVFQQKSLSNDLSTIHWLIDRSQTYFTFFSPEDFPFEGKRNISLSSTSDFSWKMMFKCWKLHRQVLVRRIGTMCVRWWMKRKILVVGEISDDSDYRSDVSNSVKIREEFEENDWLNPLESCSNDWKMNSHPTVRRLKEKSNSLTRDSSIGLKNEKRISSNHHQSIDQIYHSTKYVQ